MDPYKDICTTPLEMLYQWSEQVPDRVFLRQPVNGQYKTYTWSQVNDQARRLASALLAQGLNKGDRVAILSKNCAEWFISDYAIQLAGLISVPLYPMQTPDTLEYVLTHSDSKVIIIGKLDGATTMEPGIPENVIRIAMPYDMDMRIDHQWDSLLSNVEPSTENPIHPMDLLLYEYGILEFCCWVNIHTSNIVFSINSLTTLFWQRIFNTSVISKSFKEIKFF